jgi:NADH-quinone oxidoreductase subunit J
MVVPALFFYLFASICVASAVMVITSRNPVHSVLFLILAFVNAAGLFILLGAEFLAMILVIVYVGAVAVLFLFVVMMLDVDFTALRRGVLEHLSVGLLIGGAFCLELLLMFYLELTGGFGIGAGKAITDAIPPLEDVTNTAALGHVLYTKYAYYFEAAGLVLLVAMIGAIVLTLRHKPNVKRQNVADQVARTKATAIKIRKVQPGQGI